jgi:phosphoglucosamine mutase
VLGEQSRSRGQKPIAVIGRDPRISGEFLAAAISAGLASSGVDVFDAGVIPTPATSFLTADLDADFGVMISASHNPAPDNGIKFFSRGGHKLADDVEDQIEQALSKSALAPIGTEIGHVQEFADAKERYLVHLSSTLPNNLEGIKVVLDCANGAASDISPQAFKDSGAQVFVIGNDPDGHNINLGCGSTHLSALQATVLEHKADVGIAHDGDADRTLAVDATGAIVFGTTALGPTTAVVTAALGAGAGTGAETAAGATATGGATAAGIRAGATTAGLPVSTADNALTGARETGLAGLDMGVVIRSVAGCVQEPRRPAFGRRRA